MRAATVNALVVADSVIIPIDSSSFALLGMNQLLKTIAAISETHNPSLKINLNRARQKKQLGNIVRRIRDNSVGRADYSEIDFREDVKCACAREGVAFDNDFYDELVGRRSSADVRARL